LYSIGCHVMQYVGHTLHSRYGSTNIHLLLLDIPDLCSSLHGLHCLLDALDVDVPIYTLHPTSSELFIECLKVPEEYNLLSELYISHVPASLIDRARLTGVLSRPEVLGTTQK
jgi:hypothetical protein